MKMTALLPLSIARSGYGTKDKGKGGKERKNPRGGKRKEGGKERDR